MTHFKTTVLPIALICFFSANILCGQVIEKKIKTKEQRIADVSAKQRRISEETLRLTSPQSLRENLIWSTGFEERQFQFIYGGKLNENSGPEWARAKRQNKDDSIIFSSSFARSGQSSLKLTWRRELLSESNDSKKAMVIFGKPSFTEGLERWYGFSILLPSSFYTDNDPYNALIFQVHATPDHHLNEQWRSPPIGLSLRNGKLKFGYTYDTEKISQKNFNLNQNRKSFEIGDLSSFLDKWTDFVVHAKFSVNNKGLIELWVDGQLIVSDSNINLGYKDDYGPYPGWGIYSYNSTNQERSIYLDEVRIGNNSSSYTQVAPGRNDNTQQKPQFDSSAKHLPTANADSLTPKRPEQKPYP